MKGILESVEIVVWNANSGVFMADWKYRIVLAVFLAAAGCAGPAKQAKPTKQAKPKSRKEIWHCYDGSTWAFNLIRNRETGAARVYVAMADTMHEAAYSVEGINRRWDFGRVGGVAYRYAIILKTDGMARYFDFVHADSTGMAKPRDSFKCRRR